jgi:hypothetical protein
VFLDVSHWHAVARHASWTTVYNGGHS